MQVRRPRRLLLVATLALAGSAITALSVAPVTSRVDVAAATPTGSPAASGDTTGGDTRSPGQGPGLVGSPLLAIVVVLVIGLGTAALTLVYVRLSGGRGTRGPDPG